MTVSLLTGSAAEGAVSGDFFAGTVSPASYTVSEALADQADTFLHDMFRGRKSRQQISEALTTSSLSMAIFSAIHTQMQAAYKALTPVWQGYTAAVTVPDFRPTRLLSRWAAGFGLARVPELTEYPAGKESGKDAHWISVAKYGRRDEVSWESQVNGTAVGDIESMPDRYAKAAAETESIAAISNLLAVGDQNTATGINTTFFRAGNGNAPDTRALTADNLDAVLQEVRARKPKGEVVVPPELVVVLPRALQAQMERIMALREIRTESGGVTQVHDNYLSKTTFVVDPYLDAVHQGTNAATTWFVLPVPTAEKPGSFVARLRGHESPDMRYRSDAGQALGGGGITPLQGGFGSDGIETRVRHVIGAQPGDPTFTYASDGTA